MEGQPPPPKRHVQRWLEYEKTMGSKSILPTVEGFFRYEDLPIDIKRLVLSELENPRDLLHACIASKKMLEFCKDPSSAMLKSVGTTPPKRMTFWEYVQESLDFETMKCKAWQWFTWVLSDPILFSGLLQDFTYDEFVDFLRSKQLTPTIEPKNIQNENYRKVIYHFLFRNRIQIVTSHGTEISIPLPITYKIVTNEDLLIWISNPFFDNPAIIPNNIFWNSLDKVFENYGKVPIITPWTTDTSDVVPLYNSPVVDEEGNPIILQPIAIFDVHYLSNLFPEDLYKDVSVVKSSRLASAWFTNSMIRNYLQSESFLQQIQSIIDKKLLTESYPIQTDQPLPKKCFEQSFFDVFPNTYLYITYGRADPQRQIMLLAYIHV